MDARSLVRLVLASLADILWLVKRWVRARGRAEAVGAVRDFRSALARGDEAEVSRMLDDLLLHARGARVLRDLDRLPAPGGVPPR